MKKILSLLFSLLSVICFGQQKGEIVITWNSKSSISFGSYKLTVPKFNDANFQFDSYKKQWDVGCSAPLNYRCQSLNPNSLPGEYKQSLRPGAPAQSTPRAG